MFVQFTPSELSVDKTYTPKMRGVSLARSIIRTFREITTRSIDIGKGQQIKPFGDVPSYLSTSQDIDKSYNHPDSFIKVDTETGAMIMTTGMSECAAYGNDAIAGCLHAVSRISQRFNRAVAMSCMTGATTPNVMMTYVTNDRIRMFLNSEPSETDTKKLLRFINLYVRIPFILLDPTSSAELFARRVKPANSWFTRTVQSSYYAAAPEKFLGLKFSTAPLICPPLYWWHNALTREAFDIYFQYPEIVAAINATCSGIKINTIVNTHNWAAAKEVWNKMRPILIQEVVSKNTNNFAWFQSGQTSSLMLFERLVAAGGITALRNAAATSSTSLVSTGSHYRDWKGDPIVSNNTAVVNWQSTSKTTRETEESKRLELFTSCIQDSWGHADVARYKAHSETAWGLMNWITHSTKLDKKRLLIEAPEEVLKSSNPLDNLTYTKVRSLVKHHLLRNFTRYHNA